MRLKGEVALIQGATRGMGQVTAERFAAEGAKVVFTGRNEARGKVIEQAIAAQGGEALFVRTDITEEDDVRRAVDATVSEFGMITALVNNAGGTEHQAGASKIDDKVADISSAAWDRIFATDLKGAWLSAKYAIPAMERAGKGSIVNISSFAAELAVVGVAAYSAAKAGLHALTRSIAIEYAAESIRCNCILIGLIPNWQTEFFNEAAWARSLKACQPLRVGRESDASNAALFLCSDEASYITGAVLHVDGGLSKIAHMPELPSEGGDVEFAPDNL